MDQDFGFGEDPDGDIQYEEDRAVLNEIEHDLGKSYISERVTPAKHNAFNSFHGQSTTDNGYTMNMDEDEEKQIELMEEEILNENKPLKRKKKETRKRKRESDTDILPNAKRIKTTQPNIDVNTMEIYLHGRPSSNDTSFMVTNDTDGQQLYLYYISQAQFDREIKNSAKEVKHTIRSQEENKSIDQLLNEIENERINKEILELNGNFLDIDAKDDALKQSELWTDKYGPKRITDLLSHEKINREVTSWIKEWDYVVFGRKYSRFEAKNKPKMKKNLNKMKLNVYTMFGSNNKNKNTKNPNIINNNKKSRPEITVVLLCGPPGSGKSTLAHIVANHCGYRVVEINASNDRSGKKLKDIIINAATMKPMFGDTRPPLFVLDEIDGSMKGNGDNKSAVDVILSIVKDQNDKTKKKKLKVVNRPIICICNNLYSASLRPLRSICKIYKFRPISTRVLCKRLLDISRKEYVHSDLKTLSYLANITGNDIRCCLHTLQFFKERSHGGKRLSTRLTIDTLKTTPIGRKDKTQNIFDIWNRILKKKGKECENNNNNWNEICTMMYGFGGGTDYKIMDGVIENYLSLGYTDPMFDISFNTAQWIMEFDELHRMIKQKQQFSLMRYIPFIMIGIHEKCSTDSFQKLEYPSNSYKHRVKVRENENIIDEFLNNDIHYASILSRYFNIKSCVLELIPLLSFLIFTDKRWNNNDFDVNSMTKSNYPSNKRHFVSIIHTMIHCGLNYVKPDNSSCDLELKPAIDRLSKYSFSKQEFKQKSEIKFMNQYLKEKIAHQILLAIMRRNEAGANKYKEKGDIKTSPHKPRKKAQNVIKETPSQTPAKHKHFIARHNKKTRIQKYEYPIQYRFVEGYTNAVKRKSFCRDWI